MLKDRRTYEIMRPEDAGVKSTMVLGKHSGRHAVQKRAEELGYALTRFELDRSYRRMIILADEQKSISDTELRAIIDAVRVEDCEQARPQQGSDGTAAGTRGGTTDDDCRYSI